MSQDGTIEVAGMTLEQARQAVQAVNLDEVTTESIDVEVREFEDAPVLLSNGKALLDGQGKPRTRRKFIGTRTARIYNIVPVDVYAQAMSVFDGFGGGTPTPQQISTMGDLVWRIWTLTEDWMSRDALLNGGIDGDVVLSLFARFFDKLTRQQSA